LAAGGQLHELIPIVGVLAAAAPVLLEVMEDCLSLVVLAGVFMVVFVQVVLSAPLVDAAELPLLRHPLLLLLLGLARLLQLLLDLQLCIDPSLPLLY
jgi:hypothetical protein